MILLKLRKKINKRSFIILRTKGGGVKKLYRFLDFYGVLQVYLPSVFLTYIYDPCRSAFLGLFVYINGILSYRIGTHKLNFLTVFFVNFDEDLIKIKLIKEGFVGPLSCFKGGASFHSLPLIEGSKATLGRSAGVFLYLLRNDIKMRLSFVRIRREKVLPFSIYNLVTFGRVCNILHYEFKRGKAGISSLQGKRPIVRGIARNPVDHPNGGRTPGGKVYRSFSNKIARSTLKTRFKYRFYNRYIR